MSTTASSSSASPVPASPVPASYLLMADLLHMLVAAMALNMFLFVGSEVQLLFQLVITGLIMVVMVRGGGWLVLGAMQVSMFFYESRVEMTPVQLSTVISGVLCLGLVAYAAGFRTIRRMLREWLARMLYALLVHPPAIGERSVLTELDTRQQQLEDWNLLRAQSWQLLWRCGRMLAIVIVASIAFLQLPFTVPGIQAWWYRTVAMDYALWPGPNIFTVAMLCMVALIYGSWRRLNYHQARLYLKSLYVRDHFRELRSVLVRGKYLFDSLPRPVKPIQPVRKK